MSAPLSYAQKLLSGRTFRLLHIAPALDQSCLLECACLPYNIDEAPPYEALSYVWGDPNPPDVLLCNGQSTPIGPSLSHALRRLRYRESTRIVWVDAICINQQDPVEKSHQVPMMGSIYSLARRVVVSLGQGDAEQTQLAFMCIAVIGIHCLNHDQRQGILSDHSTRHQEIDISAEVFTPRIVGSLKELFGRPWFSRIWCIQEIRLAVDAQVIWGDKEISWRVLSMGASWIFDKTDTLQLGSGNSGDLVASLLDDIPVKNADMLRDKDNYHLLDALQHFRESESSDPRDKVYGLLNIVSPRSEVETLGVSYEKCVGQVYADTVLTVIQLYSRLTAFAYITHNVDYDGPTSQDVGNPRNDNGISGYRSWAPRWDDEAVAPPLGVPEAECPWSACGERRAVMANEISCPPEQLYLQGVVYSRVYEVGDIMDFYNLKDPDYVYDPKFTENPEDDDENIPDPQDIYAISDPTERHPFIKAFKKADVEAAPERFARTLTRGCSQYDVEEYLQDLGDSVQIRHHDACYHALQRLLSLQEFGTEGNFAHNNDSTQFEKEAYYACQQRRMFWTEKSSYGLGPQCMQTGDMVVVLYGGNTPYVLRPRGNEYIFMGQAYVDEIMNGEVFQDSTSDIPKEQTFCLI